MKVIILLGLSGLLHRGVPGPAAAQDIARPVAAPVATLYELPNFQGRQITLEAYSGDLSNLNFNDMAQSARFQGRWRICQDSEFRGRCQEVGGDAPDLSKMGLSQKISSLQAYEERVWDNAPRWQANAPWPGPPAARPIQAATGVLFPYPSAMGWDIAASGAAAAAFCKSAGLGAGAYYDASQRAARALDYAGRYVGETPVLRDVLCRRS